jgi:hypothetical protein
MKHVVLVLALGLSVSSPVLAQQRARTSGTAQSTAQSESGLNKQMSSPAASLESGTQLSAELLTRLDAKKAKPGDEFKMRTLKPILMNGQTVIAKGAVLTGHIVEASTAEGKNGVSQLKLSFDQLRNRNLTIPFSATIEQITQAAVRQQAQLNDMGSAVDLSGTTSSRTAASGRAGGQSGGGLLGGVTGTLGDTVGGVTTATTGAVTDSLGGLSTTTQQSVGGVLGVSAETLNGATANTKGLIAITSQTDAEANGNSVLSLTGGNVRLEKGVVFNLRTDKTLQIATTQPRQ